MLDIYDDLASQYADQIEPKVAGMDAGELAQFLTNYMKQVQCLLHIISVCRQGDWEADLAALDDQIQYFYAHDLFHYARLMPVHLAQMNQLENEDPITRNALKEGNCCVRKSDSSFTALFADQALEQKIKELNRVGHLVGITHDEVSLDHVIITLPHMTSISMLGCVDTHASQLPPILRVSIISCLEASLNEKCTEVEGFHPAPLRR